MPPTAGATAPPAKAGARQWLGLAVLALPTILLALDQSVLFLALPHLAESLRPTGSQTLWIMDIYGFMMAGFLVTMGTLGDRIGRRRVLMIGATAVGAASVAAAYAPSTEMLIVTRALLGLAAAGLMPSTLSLISNMFPDPGQRGRAIAVWASSFMAGTALGPVIGGVLLEYFWWGSVFLLGVPVMVALLIAAPFLLPEYRDPAGGRLDPVSVVLSLGAILPVVYGLKEFARLGWQPLSPAALAAGLVIGTVFVRRQRTLAHPLLDLRLFRYRAFTVSLLVLMLTMTTMGGSYLFITGFLQMVQGLSPIEAGLWMVPSALASIAAAMTAPALAKRLSAGAVIAGGLGVAAAGYLLLALVGAEGGLPLLVTGFVLAFFGTGPIGALSQNLVISSAPPEKSGSAAAMSETSGQLGVSLGIAALGSLGAAVYRTEITVPQQVPAEDAEAARGGLESALATAQGLPDRLGDQVLTAARDAYTSGLNAVGITCAALVAGTAVLTAMSLRGTDAAEPPEAGRATAEPPEEEEEERAGAVSVRPGRHAAARRT
ncbi:MFS transporter [Streptomyces sp. NPDC004134]|uniref:MFS transporter n=1 Tax=Streptomyces sp. NPDC004134 TaxID=3364691 RepID=UPI00369BE2C4